MTRLVPSAETAYVRQGRALFSIRFPGEGHSFDAPSWDVRHLRTSQHKKANARAYFTVYGSELNPLPPRFANVVKAYLLLNRTSGATMVLGADVARMLWEAILLRFDTADGFDWSLLVEDDLLRTEQIMLAHWSQSTTYKRCTQLQFMLRALAAAPGGGIVRPMDVAFTTPRTDDSERYTLDGQLDRMKRLPSDDAMYAVADIYAKYAKEPPDRLIACILAVMMATALRIGEALTLPLDCLFAEGAGAKKRWGIRYHKEKSRGGQKQLAVRWMTPKQAELAKRAIQEANRLMAPVRERAKTLEARPDRVTLPGVPHNALLGRDEVSKFLGMTSRSVSQIPTSKLPRTAGRMLGSVSTKKEYRAADVGAYLLRLRVRDLWVVDRRDGTRQSLSESLFIAFRNFFHERRGTNPLLVEPVTEETVNDFLRSRKNEGHIVSRSAFEHFDLKDGEGQFFRLHSHQFRHWVTTKAAAAGVPDEVIARWQGREHVGDLEAYKHLTPSERVATLRAALESGRTKGRVAEMYFNLHDDVRDAFLDGQLQAVHVTPLGLCVHDFKVSPCPKMLNCVKDCDDYLFDTANDVHRQNLIQLRARTQQTLQHAEAQKSRGGVDLSENWIADAKATLAGVDRVLDADARGGATIVRPNAGRASRFEAPVKD
jgi:hypothetical protein